VESGIAGAEADSVIGILLGCGVPRMFWGCSPRMNTIATDNRSGWGGGARTGRLSWMCRIDLSVAVRAMVSRDREGAGR
jgi:hypothetical protein